MGWGDGLILPAEITEFEVEYLERMNRYGLWFAWLNLPLLVVVAWANDTGPVLASLLTLMVVFGPTYAWSTLRNPRHISMVYGAASMCLGGLLVHFGQGPMQIEMHFYFFSLLAMLAVFGNPAVVLTAAATVTFHHTVILFLLPESVFNYDASLSVVAVHATFVVVESVVACFIARSFFDNVIGLERIVAARTAELKARNDKIRRMLDTVEQGFVTVGTDLSMSDERSAAVDDLLGGGGDPDLANRIANHDPTAAEWLRLGWEELDEAVLPRELALAQLPDHVKTPSGALSLAYVPVEGSDEILVVITDISAKLARDAAEADRAELVSLFDRFVRDRNGFLDFHGHASDLVEQIRVAPSLDGPVERRALHTLKGNVGLFGLLAFARLVHELEDALGSDEVTVERARSKVLARWAAIQEMVGVLVDGRQDLLDVTGNDLDDLQLALRTRPVPEVAARIDALRREPVGRALERVREQVAALADRLGKSIDVVVTGEGVRLDRSRMRPFWSAFVHVVRNAVDHGIEDRDDRIAAGKSAFGTITVRVEQADDQVVVSLEDDGRGVNWDRVQAHATRAGLPGESPGELNDALFADGFTTREEATLISGKGVGLAAVREIVDAMGGSVSLRSEQGRGTQVVCRLPAETSAALGIAV